MTIDLLEKGKGRRKGRGIICLDGFRGERLPLVVRGSLLPIEGENVK